jgi:hypothetical protein
MAVFHTPGVGGGPSGITKVAEQVGKPGRQQALGSPHRSAPPTITGGNPVAGTMMHNYAKQPSPAAVGGSSTGMPGTTGVDPTSHPGATMIRGGKGGMKKNPRSGGLGPGPMSTPGGDNNYDATSQDVE